VTSDQDGERLQSQSFGKQLRMHQQSSARRGSSLTGGLSSESLRCSHPVELPQVLLLGLVDHGQDSGDGFTDNTAATTKNHKVRPRSVGFTEVRLTCERSG